MINPRERIILALDLPGHNEAMTVAHSFRNHIDFFKIGSELFTAAGPRIIKELHLMGKKVFLDLKFHDIPSTVAKAVRAAAEHGVFMMNVHCLGGLEMMKSAADALTEFTLARNIERPRLIGVTILTSIDQETLRNELFIETRLHTQVKHLAGLAQRAGLDGVVASAEDAESLRARFGKNFLIVTPGIRPSWSESEDQKRIFTPRRALQMGSDYLVIGRPVLASRDPVGALNRIFDEIADI